MKLGEKVLRGQVVAALGNTGAAMGLNANGIPHVFKSVTGGGRVRETRL